MSTDRDKLSLNEDDNALDEFHAVDFFKRKSKVTNEVTISQASQLSNSNVKKHLGILNDSTNKNRVFKKADDHSVRRKRTISESNSVYGENNEKRILRIGTKNESPPYKKIIDSTIIFDRQPYTMDEQSYDSLSGLDNGSEFVSSLCMPAHSYNPIYTNQITVPEPRICEKFQKTLHNTSVWHTMMETAKVETRTLSNPCRESCTPHEQYLVTPTLQYKSQCLIQAMTSMTDSHDMFPETGVAAIYRQQHDQNRFFMSDSINTSHFHDMYLEKLPCNQLFDFLSLNSELSGHILGVFVNDMFELSRHIRMPDEVVHIAVDYIYQYLSRVQNVPLCDLKLIALGAIWVASKLLSQQSGAMICHYTALTQHKLKHAELRLLMVIDFNITKPSVISFRDRLLIIEPSTSTVTHLSSFILDMTLLCYTIMVLPASKRAAAALWLARLIDKFDDVKSTYDVHNSDLHRIMDTVWPDHYHALSGYHHSEIAQLAIQMHVVVLALLSRSGQNDYSMKACYNKYSEDGISADIVVAPLMQSKISRSLPFEWSQHLSFQTFTRFSLTLADSPQTTLYMISYLTLKRSNLSVFLH